jgi:hypothetical protein
MGYQKLIDFRLKEARSKGFTFDWACLKKRVEVAKNNDIVTQLDKALGQFARRILEHLCRVVGRIGNGKYPFRLMHIFIPNNAEWFFEM